MSLSLNNRGVPGAAVPSGQAFWLVPIRPMVISATGGRSFGADRENSTRKVNGVLVTTQGSRYHAGTDLYCSLGDVIVAPEDCEIVNYYHFYRGTYCLIVKTSSQVLNIGEVRADSLSYLGHKSPTVRLKPGRTYENPVSDMTSDAVAGIVGTGSTVKAGEPLAIVGKMNIGSMLHFEVYTSGTVVNSRWKRSEGPPSNLKDPTPYLQALKASYQTRTQKDAVALQMVEDTAVNSRQRKCGG